MPNLNKDDNHLMDELRNSEPPRESDPTASRRKLKDLVPPPEGGDPIEIFEIDLSNKEELLKFKPKNTRLTDAEWVLACGGYGVFHVLAELFSEWCQNRKETAELVGDPKRKILYGKAAEEALSLSKDRPVWTEYILSRPWALSELGLFGQWVEEAGIDQKYAIEILREYLND